MRRRISSLYRAVVVAVGVALATVFTVVVASPAANASATGCAYWGALGPIKGIPVYNGSMCFRIVGTGTHLSSMADSWSSYGNTCNWWEDVDAYDLAGNKYYHQQGAAHLGCGRTGSEARSINVNGKSGRVCGTLYTNAIRLVSVCHSVHP